MNFHGISQKFGLFRALREINYLLNKNSAKNRTENCFSYWYTPANIQLLAAPLLNGCFLCIYYCLFYKHLIYINLSRNCAFSWDIGEKL
jgi:hypothetical protein